MDRSSRSLAKAISWRLFGSVATMAIVFVLTGRLDLAATAGVLEITGKIALYYFHERMWDRIGYGRRDITAAVIWLTGLPASGKTTIAARVVNSLVRLGHRVEHLDGDAVRHVLPETGFSKDERDAHVRRLGFLASRLEANGIVVVVSLVSPFRGSRDFARGLCNRFIEVYVATPLEECERRDPRGLYARARAGNLKQLTGIDDDYEPPTTPEVVIDTTKMSEEEASARVLERFSLRHPALA